MARFVTIVLRVKGTHHYAAEEALSSGDLNIGSAIKLKPEPNNPHDSNAVEVYSSRSKKLGHVSKDIAKKYQTLCFGDQIIEAKVDSATKSSDYYRRGLDIRVKVTYLTKGSGTDLLLPSTPGVYEISMGLSRVYVGSTGDLKSRCKQHLSQLQHSIHSNQPLQNDFDRQGQESFSFNVIADVADEQEALVIEAQEIRKRLRSGAALYNKTIDGQGRAPADNASARTVSDFLSPEAANLPDDASPEGLTERVDQRLGSHGFGPKVDRSGEYQGQTKDGKRNGVGRLNYKNGDWYEGFWLDDMRHGAGRMEWHHGGSYEGAWQQDKMTGFGKYRWKNGDCYEGAWLNGKRDGVGTFTYLRGTKLSGIWKNDTFVGDENELTKQSPTIPKREKNRIGGRVKPLSRTIVEFTNGDTYEETTSSRQRRRSGIYRFSDGTSREGLWTRPRRSDEQGGYSWSTMSLDGEKHGRAQCTFANGDVYEGDWSEGQFTGNGTMRSAGGDVYEGAWLNGKRSGFGIETAASGRRYEGQWLGDKEHGQGRATYFSGNSYDGAFSLGLRHGWGKMTYANGDVYEGEWQDGMEHGPGTKISSDGILFEGVWSKGGAKSVTTYEGEISNGQPNGRGKAVLPNGDTYLGQWLNGKKHGKGRYTAYDGIVYSGVWANGEIVVAETTQTIRAIDEGPTDADEGSSPKKLEGFRHYTFSDGSTYDGLWNKGLRHGRGKYVWAFGSLKDAVYDGNWKKGYPDGQGIITFANGVSYEGAFLGGEQHGKGTLILPNGGRYDGEFINNRRTGVGRHVYASGDIYEGEFLDGARNGRGTYTWPDGERYEGEFTNNSRTGFGTHVYVNGDVYEGEFLDGKRHGEGAYVRPNGERYEGGWLEDDRHGFATDTDAEGGVLQTEYLHGVEISGATDTVPIEEEAPEAFTGHRQLTLPNGDVYDGEWKAGEFHGSGTLEFANGDYYDGDFRKGKKHGEGVEFLSDGVSYVGGFKNNKRHGQGRYSDAKDEEYDGEWKAGVLTAITSTASPIENIIRRDNLKGDVAYHYPNGNVYRGDWLKGKPNGFGILKTFDDDVFEGNWKDGALDGFAIASYSDGDFFSGEWLDGVEHGKGVFKTRDGDVFRGVWKHGEPKYD